MRARTSLLPALAFLSLAACAPLSPPPYSQISQAASAVSLAESEGAHTAAPLELAAAREKLSSAKLAAQRGDNLAALQLAEQAKVDADLAQAKARTARSQRAAEDLRAEIRALQEEMERKTPR